VFGYAAANSGEEGRVVNTSGGARRPRPTSFDVAREAGVSQTTVSLVLRQAATRRISPETEERVRRVAERLGYRPNEAGRTLKAGGSRLIGLVVPDVTDPYFATVMQGAEAVAWEANHVVGLLEGRGEAGLARLVDGVLSSWMTGLIICAPTPAELAGLQPIASRTVALDGHRDDLKASITYDIAAGMAQAVGHLTALGHTRIGQVSTGTEAQTVERRRVAFDRCVPDGRRVTVAYPLDVERTTADLAAFLAANPGLTALVCDTDVLAAVTLAAARDVGLRVPADLSVVGFNDSDVARFTRPALTTVALPARRTGALATSLLLRGSSEERAYVLEPALTVRDSTAPPSPAR
jgi:DNA-binding LacI/PurR family transcriptional regulator